jgi:hypothetical protein
VGCHRGVNEIIKFEKQYKIQYLSTCITFVLYREASH